MKTHFGDTLRTHDEQAQANEIRLKYLVRNLENLCSWEKKTGRTADFHLGWRVAHQTGSRSLEDLHRAFNGPTRRTSIEALTTDRTAPAQPIPAQPHEVIA